MILEKFRVLAMGRKRVQMKLIEDKRSRHVTFSKRRSGLMKKASELSVLCDVEVALIIFSGSGRLYEFSSSQSIGKTLERYRTNNVIPKVAVNKADKKPEKYQTECGVPQKVAELLKMMSNLKVEQLTIQELIHLERDLGVMLGQTRQRKTHLMMETTTTLAEKVAQLGEEKHLLENQIGRMMECQSRHQQKELRLIQLFA